MGRISEWKEEFIGHKWVILLSILFLAFSVFLNYAAGSYVSKTSGAAAQDIILDNVPTFDLDFLFLYGSAFIIIIFFVYPLFFKVKEVHKVISQFSLLVLVRSAFICLTHLQTPQGALVFRVPYIFTFFIFQNGLFFSGHTALPFLGFLLYKSKMRYFFLFSSILMALCVLLMHVHYTIDVFSAFFITYGTFKIGEKIFSKLNHYNG